MNFGHCLKVKTRVSLSAGTWEERQEKGGLDLQCSFPGHTLGAGTASRSRGTELGMAGYSE